MTIEHDATPSIMLDPNVEPPTPEQVLDEARKLAAERPDFVYTAQEGHDPGSVCGYVGRNAKTDEGEGCIVGQALVRLGVSAEWLLHTERTHGGLGAGNILDTMHPDVDFYAVDYVEPLAIRTLKNVQDNQDHGYGWGEAMAEALGEEEG